MKKSQEREKGSTGNLESRPRNSQGKAHEYQAPYTSMLFLLDSNNHTIELVGGREGIRTPDPLLAKRKQSTYCELL